ncbi:XAC2610-related protein [Flavobacterium flavipallidum]|uniref:Nuclear transport factor 2 family protein n=1 Tax=Flavobacterium flavipallidum TaxID=3139140 RepID=A0ABU9HN28_9FLAO
MKTLTFIFSLIILMSCNSQSKKIDEVILKTKSQKLLKAFNAESQITSSDYDSLIDLNYDNVKDFVIGYYGLSGTGIKNLVQVYLYDLKKNNYVLNNQLSELRNPSFYIAQKKITEFYIGNGGGSGSQLEWINGKWIVTKMFEVDYNEIKTVWKITYPREKKTEYFAKPYQMIPPKDILETTVKE